MDIEQLRAFMTVAELGSQTRAAARMHLTQPALSRRIQQLEEHVGVALFERTGRGVALTEAGLLMRHRVAPVLDELDSIADDVAASEDRVRGVVSLAVPPSVGAQLPCDLVEAVAERYPEVSLRVAVALSGAVRDGLERGSLDLGILYSPLQGARWHAETLWDESLLLVGSSELRLCDPVRLKDALRRPLVLPSRAHGLRDLVEAHALRHRVELDVRVEADSLRLLLELTRRGLGCTMLPATAFAGELASGLVSAAPIARPKLVRSTMLAWPKNRRTGRAAERVAALIREATAG